MKKFILIFLLLSLPVSAAQLSDLILPKPPAYRVGTSDTPEKEYVEITTIKQETPEETSQKKEELPYTDLKRLSIEISKELDMDEKEMMADLSLLWRGAATQSDTINFALYKLANPDADKPDEKSFKKVLTTIASMSSMVGAGMGNPILAASSLVGGNIFGIMSQDTKALNYKYTRVNDADMIILVRKVEDLQQKAVDLYYDYMTLRNQLKMVEKLVDQRKKNYELAQDSSREVLLVTDTYYRAALDLQAKTQADFNSKRAALEQFVGNEIFRQFEKELETRK